MEHAQPKPTILLVESSVREADPEQWSRAQSLFNFIKYDCENTDEFCERLKPGGPYSEIDAIVRVGWLKAGKYAQHYLFSTPFVPQYPPSLKLICCTGHGHDAADIEALTKRGILYANTPDTCTESVANTALYLILDTFRHFGLAEYCVRTDNWFGSRELGTTAIDPEGHVLGIIGMGDIGLRIAKKAAAGLDMEIHYHNRQRRGDAEATLPGGATYHAELDSLLAISDCICIACPLLPATRKLLSSAQFARMKRGVRIVNIARGQIIDEEALIQAMDAGTVGSVGLDVHANEPGVNPQLLDRVKSTTLLPHIGVCSRTSWRNFDLVGLDNLYNYFYGDRSKVKIVNALP